MTEDWLLGLAWGLFVGLSFGVVIGWLARGDGWTRSR
jgi:hypothetical protein